MILPGGHTASCFRTGNCFCYYFIYLFEVALVNSIASSQPLESSPLSSHVVVWDSVPLEEGARMKACEGLPSPQSLGVVEVTRSHCNLQH